MVLEEMWNNFWVGLFGATKLQSECMIQLIGTLHLLDNCKYIYLAKKSHVNSPGANVVRYFKQIK